MKRALKQLSPKRMNKICELLTLLIFDYGVNDFQFHTTLIKNLFVCKELLFYFCVYCSRA
jgi:hypothetical protein